MSGRKKKARASKSQDRVVYSEFGTEFFDDLSSESSDLAPGEQNLKVQVSRKGRKGKTVTVIQGFQHTPETLTKLAKELKAKCGSGGTAKEQTIEIQGEHANQLLDLLTQKGYRVKRAGG